jgi:hypothetical protein
VRVEQVPAFLREDHTALVVAKVDGLDEPLVAEVVECVVADVEIVLGHDTQSADGGECSTNVARLAMKPSRQFLRGAIQGRAEGPGLYRSVQCVVVWESKFGALVSDRTADSARLLIDATGPQPTRTLLQPLCAQLLGRTSGGRYSDSIDRWNYTIYPATRTPDKSVVV